VLKQFWIGIGKLKSDQVIMKLWLENSLSFENWHCLHLFIVNIDSKFDQSLINQITRCHEKCLTVLRETDLDSPTELCQKRIRKAINKLCFAIDSYLINIEKTP
jgi:hypothetical protein